MKKVAESWATMVTLAETEKVTAHVKSRISILAVLPPHKRVANDLQTTRKQISLVIN